MKTKLKEKAIFLRRKGLSYSQILKEVPVSKSTIALWLREVGLSKRQKQKLSLKRLQAGMRGAAKRKRQRITLETKIKSESSNEIGNISDRELWLIGTALYWAEGSKQKEHNPSQKFVFSNSDPNMIKLYLQWLIKCVDISTDRIEPIIYIHETWKREMTGIISFWSKVTGFPEAKFVKIYFKHNKLNTLRRNISHNYHGLLRVEVAKSTNLVRKVAGWIEGINKSI